MKRPEQEAQIALIAWANLAACTIPELAMLYHIPNGGKRTKVDAARLKQMGVKPGVPDLCLPIPRNGCSGLWIEMKAGKGKPTDSQHWWLSRLSEYGHAVAVCTGWEEARAVILSYLSRQAQPLGSVQ